MRRKATIIGNGPSRLLIPLHKIKDTTFGCNAIYRDFHPDYVVAIDDQMVREIRQSSFPQHRVLVPIPHEHWEPAELHNGNGRARRSNAGINALREALKREYNPITMIGFDFLLNDPEQATQNIYEGTQGYGPEYRATAEDSVPRLRYFDFIVKNMAKDINIIVVVPKDVEILKIDNPQITYISVDDYVRSL